MKKISIITFLMLLMQVAIGQITFSYDDSGNRVRRNSASGPIYSLSINSQTGLTNVAAAGGSNLGNFVVASTNVNWNISGVPSWATVSSSSGGNGNATINVSYTANGGTTSSRTANLTISGNNGVSSQTVTISQVGSGSGGGGCVVNKVRLVYRGGNLNNGCCFERLIDSKIQGSNDGNNWTDLYIFNQSGNGNWQDFTFNNTTSYTAIRFQAGPTSWGELSELEFYNGTTKLSGTTFGTDSYALAFDSDINTGWHASSTSGPSNYAGLQLSGCSGGGCSSPQPTITANPASGVPTTLTASGCVNASGVAGTVTWNDQTIGTTKSVGSVGTYTASCTNSGCTVSSAGTINVSNTPPSTSCQIYPTGANSGNSSEYRDYTVNVTNAGNYNILLSYASGESPTGTMLISGTLRSFPLPTTAGWSNYTDRTVLMGIPLVAGNNVIRVSTAGGTFSHIKVCATLCSSCRSINNSGFEGINKSSDFETDFFGTDPNPSTGKVMVNFKGEKGTTGILVVHDMTGKTLVTDSIEANIGKLIELPNHFVGVSLFTLTTDTFMKTKKVMIMK